MNPIQKYFSKVSDQFKTFLKSYPFSLLAILFFTIYSTFFTNTFLSNSVPILNFLGLWALGIIFSESFFPEKKRFQYLAMVITALVSATLAYCIQIDLEGIERFCMAYGFSAVLLTLYACLKNSQKGFGGYLTNTFANLLNIGISYLILAIGFSILYIIFANLLMDNQYGTFFMKMQLLLAGLYLAPGLLYSVSHVREKISSFIQSLVLYVGLPLVSIALAIVYIYLIKIFVTHSVPKNAIYRIVVGIFIVAYPLANMVYDIEKKPRVLGILAKVVEYALIPLLAVEIYTVTVRIQDYGLSSVRYISLTFILLQAIALFFNFYQKKTKMASLFLAGTAFVLILTITPLNYFTVPIWDQTAQLKKALPDNQQFVDLTENQKAKAYSSYMYLKALDSKGRYIPGNISDTNKQQIESYQKNTTSFTSKVGTITEQLSAFPVDVSSYHYMHPLNYYNDISFMNLQQLKIACDDGKTATVNMQDYLNEIIDLSNHPGKFDFQSHHEIQLNNSYKLVLKSIYLSYNKADNQPISLNFSGYLLEK